MGLKKIAVFLLAATSMSFSQTDSPAPKVFPYPYVQEDLPNGLRLITIPTDYPNIVALYIVVNTGSRNEVEPGKSGFAHLFEHLMFRGTAGISARDLSERTGEGRAPPRTPSRPTISPPSTPTFSKEDLPRILSMEADRFQHLAYDQAAFQDRNSRRPRRIQQEQREPRPEAKRNPPRHRLQGAHLPPHHHGLPQGCGSHAGRI